MSNGEVIVFFKNQNNDQFTQKFNDLYADLILGLYRKQNIDFIMNSLAKKYYMSDDECRREIKHAVNVLAEWKIVLRDDQFAAR